MVNSHNPYSPRRVKAGLVIGAVFGTAILLMFVYQLSGIGYFDIDRELRGRTLLVIRVSEHESEVVDVILSDNQYYGIYKRSRSDLDTISEGPVEYSLFRKLTAFRDEVCSVPSTSIPENTKTAKHYDVGLRCNRFNRELQFDRDELPSAIQELCVHAKCVDYAK